MDAGKGRYLADPDRYLFIVRSDGCDLDRLQDWQLQITELAQDMIALHRAVNDSNADSLAASFQPEVIISGKKAMQLQHAVLDGDRVKPVSADHIALHLKESQLIACRSFGGAEVGKANQLTGLCLYDLPIGMSIPRQSPGMGGALRPSGRQANNICQGAEPHAAARVALEHGLDRLAEIAVLQGQLNGAIRLRLAGSPQQLDHVDAADL